VSSFENKVVFRLDVALTDGRVDKLVFAPYAQRATFYMDKICMRNAEVSTSLRKVTVSHICHLFFYLCSAFVCHLFPILFCAPLSLFLSFQFPFLTNQSQVIAAMKRGVAASALPGMQKPEVARQNAPSSGGGGGGGGSERGSPRSARQSDREPQSEWSVGQMVLARYADDGKFYKARIERILPGGRFLVSGAALVFVCDVSLFRLQTILTSYFTNNHCLTLLVY
jgi:hypothetical protein